MGYEMRHTDPGYTDWRVRVMCLNGKGEVENEAIWAAYEYMKLRFGEETGAHPETPKTAYYGARSVCCSELTDDVKAIEAAFLCGLVLEKKCSAADLGEIFGIDVQRLVEKAVELERANHGDYDRLLASGLREEVVAIEAAALWCKAERTILDYFDKEDPEAEFRHRGGLLLRVGDPLGRDLAWCYKRLEILLEYIKPGWRHPMLNQRTGIVWVCENVFSRTRWPLPEKDEVRECAD